MLIHQLYAAAARNNPDKTAFVCGNQAVTYRRLAANAELYARTLLGLGLRPGDRAAFLMGNIPEIIEMYMACSRAGIIAVPVSCYSRPAEIVYALNHCGARLILAGRELAQTARAAQPHIPSLTAIYTVDDPADPWQQAARSAPATRCPKSANSRPAS